ncbi:MAG: V-type ATP synthase subunit K, partial [Candidatus Omnitrophica bacterium]|nr:V-type ATP synthase subunit K [Candidatus Omnitrophota bacterium]
MEFGLVFAILGAVCVMVFSGIGSSIGVALAGQAAAGVMTEDPDKFGLMIPLVGIAGTQGFYGFLLGFLVITKLNLLGEVIKVPTVSQGLQFLCIGALVGIVELASAVYQGKVAVGSIGIVAKKKEEAGKAIVLPVFVEIYAILGLAAAFL